MFLSNVLVADPSVMNQSMISPTIEQRIISVDPILLEIAKCESHVRQFNADGSVLRGLIDHDDTGIFQINRRYHLQAALQMGLDIDTVEGNIKYAEYLFGKQGTRPWSASQSCWLEKISTVETLDPLINKSKVLYYKEVKGRDLVRA